jgi:hypothetical protein
MLAVCAVPLAMLWGAQSCQLGWSGPCRAAILVTAGA